MITHVRIDVSSRDGNVLLGETQSIQIGADGLVGVLDMLGYKSASLLCFPSEEQTGDETNGGDPFISICNLFLPSNVSSIKTKLHDASYEISEGSAAQIWVRGHGPPKTDDINVGDTGFNTHAPFSQMPRAHLPCDV